MAAPRVIGNDHFLETQCLAFTQALVSQKIGFNIQITSGSFSFSFDNKGNEIIASARTPSEAKKKSPSTRRRNARRRKQFLENKKLQLSACDKPAHFEQPQSACEKPPQPYSKEIIQTPTESLCFPSSESADLDSNNLGGGHITKRLRMEAPIKVPPLKVLVDRQAQSSPKYRIQIQQVDGNCTVSDLSLCDIEQPNEHGDDLNMDLSISCPNCDLAFTSIFHQCHDSDLPSDQISQHIQTNNDDSSKVMIDRCNPIEIHNKRTCAKIHCGLCPTDVRIGRFINSFFIKKQ